MPKPIRTAKVVVTMASAIFSSVSIYLSLVNKETLNTLRLYLFSSTVVTIAQDLLKNRAELCSYCHN